MPDTALRERKIVITLKNHKHKYNQITNLCNVLFGLNVPSAINLCVLRSYLITGLDCGLDCWTGLMDWITGLNLFISHDLHPIKCHKFGYSNCTSSSHCMLGNVHERTTHKLQCTWTDMHHEFMVNTQ